MRVLQKNIIILHLLVDSTVDSTTGSLQKISREVLGIMKSFINFVPNLNTTIYTRQK